MRWQPSEFWGATVLDVMDASDGFAAYKGVKTARDPSKYPTRESAAALRRKLIERHGHA